MRPDWLGFLGVVVLAYTIPGPDFAVIVRAAAQSRRAGLAAAVGAQCGLCVHMLAATVGLSLLLVELPGALVALQLAGAAYLVHLGVRTLLASGRTSSRAADRTGRGGVARGWWRQGLTTNLLNPKAVLFFVSLLPQFTDPQAPLPPQILLLGVVDVAVGLLLWAALAIGASRLSRRLAAPAARRRWDRATGGVFVGLGVVLAATHA